MTTFALKLLEDNRKACIDWGNEARARRFVAQQKVAAEQAQMNKLDNEIHDLDKAIEALTYSTNGDQT